MISLDMRTIVFSCVVTDIVCMLVILLLWYQSRKRFGGTGFWVVDFFLQTAAIFLIILRGSIPDLMSIVLSNTLVIGGAILGYMGLGRFVGKKTSQFHNYVLLAAFACVHAYFTFIQPNLAARNFNVSVGLLIICFQCMWFLVYTIEPGMRPLTLGVGMVFGGYCLVSIVRIVRFFIGSPPANDYFHFSAFESLILISYQILFILLTYVLALMVNKRLFLEVSAQEEKFAKAFHSSPYTIMLTRLSDGEIIEVNERFLNTTGYQYAETVGKTSVDLHLWDKKEDRVVVVNELSKSGKVQGREFQFRKKSGEAITGLLSAEIIRIDNQEFILSSISDITERKSAEEVLREYERVIENSQDMVVVVDQDCKYVLANSQFLKYRLLNREQVIGQSVRDIVGGEVFEKVLKKNIDACFQGETVHYEMKHTYPELGERDLLVGYFPVENPERIRRIVSITQDITERKRAEEALRKARDELEIRVQERTAELAAINEELRVENKERLRVESVLRESQNRLRELSTVLLSAQERERKRIAEEIHDSMGASLAATKFKVESALNEMGDGNPQTKAALESVIPIIQETIEEARRIQMSLRPSMLDDLGILVTINWFCQQYESIYPAIHIRKEIDIQEHEVPESLKIVIYRILQEALNNIAKHSKAPLVLLYLRKAEQAIQLIVQDSGQGFDLEEASSRKGSAKGLGLDSMRERAELSGGAFSIESNKGAGTVIQATWPIEQLST